MKKYIFTFATAALLFSCSSDDTLDPELENEEELITDFDITLSAAGLDDVVLSADDPDGDEEIDSITGGTLVANTVYTGSITLTNELAEDDEDPNVTAEIQEEDDEHQFFFIPVAVDADGEPLEDVLNITTTYLDFDEDGNPLGLSFTLTTGEASVGDFAIVLRHELDKNAEGVSEGDITEAGGSTDISVDFPIVIE